MVSSSAARRPVLPAVNGLRFAAVMHVVLIHSIATRWLPFPLYSAIRAGYTSTSALFVLSGFILTWVYSGADGRLAVPRRTFLAGRLSRIFPLLVLSQLLTLPIWLQTHHGLDAWLAFGLSLTGQQGWVIPWATVLNTPAWAVGVFCASYLLLPWLLERIRGLSQRGLLVAMGVTWAACLLPGIALHVTGLATESARMALYTFPPLRLPEFVFGVLAGRFVIVHGPLPRRTAAWAATLGAAAWLGWISIASLFPIELIHNGLLAPAQALLIAGLAYGGGLPGRVLAWKPVRAMGTRSLAIYLLHLPLLAGMQTLGAFPRTSVAVSLAVYLAYVALTIGGAMVVADYFVDPIAARIRRRFAARRPSPSPAAASREAPVATIAAGG